jgi:menaquinone-dependent protoporphyrinogen oxidase
MHLFVISGRASIRFNEVNNMKKVLIVYGSRFGCTEEVSQEIARLLEKEDIAAQLLDVRKTKERMWPAIDEFDGILVGSGIKISKWTKESRKFLEKNKTELEKKILGLFVCCADAARDRNHAKKEYLEKVIEELGIAVGIYDAFGGVLDFSESSRMGFLNKKMLRAAAKEMSEEIGFTIDKNAKNDLRDWDQIRKFAEEFASLVKR